MTNYSINQKAMKKERKIAHIDSVLDWNLDSIPVTED